jgi:hypothetical protein
MARLPTLVDALTAADGRRDRATIANIARAIREAGLLPPSARGRGATPMTWRVTRPDGKAWARLFRTKAAAWRVIVGGCNSERERRDRVAERLRAGWTVKAERPPQP